MAADYNKPVTTDNYADLLTQLRDNITAAQSLLNDLTGVTNIPTGALRYDQTAKKLQTYNGSSFVDSVLSPAGGGTGITNWAKASTAEAEAGTANKYPDAAGVVASIAANGYSGSNLQTIWTGSASSVDLDTISGGFPGDGKYIVKMGALIDIYLKDSTECNGYGAMGGDSVNDSVTLKYVKMDTSNVLSGSAIIILVSSGGVLTSTNVITAIYKVI